MVIKFPKQQQQTKIKEYKELQSKFGNFESDGKKMTRLIHLYIFIHLANISIINTTPTTIRIDNSSSISRIRVKINTTSDLTNRTILIIVGGVAFGVVFLVLLVCFVLRACRRWRHPRMIATTHPHHQKQYDMSRRKARSTSVKSVSSKRRKAKRIRSGLLSSTQTSSSSSTNEVTHKNYNFRHLKKRIHKIANLFFDI